MALADPQIVTLSSVATTLPRTSSGVNSGTFRAPDSSLVLTVSHAYGKRNRRVVRLDHTKIAADPLTSVNTKFGMSVYTVFDVPGTGYTVAEAAAVVAAHTKALTDTSGALVTKILGGEN